MTTLANIGTNAAATLAKKAKRTMFVFLAVIAVIVGMTAGSVYSQGDRTQFAPTSAQEPAQVSSEAWDRLTAPASRKVRCIMPPAWRRVCHADNR
jgi:hypothetical protein